MGSGDYGPAGDYPPQGNGDRRYGAQGVPPQFQPPGWPPAGQPPYPPQYQPQQFPQPPYDPQRYYPQPPHRPRKSRKGLAGLGCGGLAVLVILIAVIAGSHSSSSAPPAVQQQPAAPAQPAVNVKAPAKPPAAQTVTYVVTGSAANVTYGPTGTSLSGTVPMAVTKPLGTPLYYSITAQLQGGGSVSCKIEVDGKVISSSTATGGYNLAMCEISPDPLSGQWSNTNG